MDNLTVVIPYRDAPEAVRACLDSLPSDLPAIVVDDCSEPPLRLRRKGVKCLHLTERGYFSGAVNVGLAACDTDVLVLNQDVTLCGDWQSDLSELRERYALIGDGVFEHPAWPKGYVQGTCMFMRRDAIQAVGLLDAESWPLWGATAQWQLRACRAGFKALPMRGLSWIEHERGEKPYGSAIQKLLAERPDLRDWLIRTPPLVSIVTACYNYGRYLPDLVASLRGGDSSLGYQPGQTQAAWELVICDDRSTDDSWERAKALRDEWSGIRCVRRKANGGTAAALNTAIRHSYGRYIVVIDADDMLAPTAIEEFYKAISSEGGAGKLWYTDQLLFADGKFTVGWKFQEYDFEDLLVKNHVPTGACFSRQAWLKVGGFPETFARGRQDWAFAIAMGVAGYCGQRIAKPLYYYRREGQNRSITNTSPSHHEAFLRQLRETFPNIYRGVRPMGCCGGRGSRIVPTRKAPAPLVPGSEGMVLLEYIGRNTGRQYFNGRVTQTRYVVKGSRRKVYVDSRDVPGMLDLVADHQLIFRPAQQIDVGAPVANEVEDA